MGRMHAPGSVFNENKTIFVSPKPLTIAKFDILKTQNIRFEVMSPRGIKIWANFQQGYSPVRPSLPPQCPHLA